ncbi:MAG: FHA domain-containing protein [Planctomycetales bacterium]|nr:FHA domain-containing protein [Planctomycetales bacterium]
MFTISILQTSGSRKGNRYRVDSSPFVIGRDEQCELVFPSRTISRKHCVIIFNDSDVLIKDLGSRNGTFVDDEQIPPDVPRQLAHHNRLWLGKYTFRVSIRDINTNRPHRPELIDLSTLSGPLVVPSEKAKGAAQLLSELDDLAARLDVKPTMNQPIAGADESTAESASKVRPDAETRHLKPSVDKVAPDAENGEQPTKVATDSSTDEPDSETVEVQSGPQKIPNHLRPKGPKDSQSAAAKALKNLFLK